MYGPPRRSAANGSRPGGSTADSNGMSMAVVDRSRTGDALARLMGSGELPRRAPPAAASAPPARAVQRLSVVVPARDEAANLGALLQELQDVLAPLALPFVEVVVVDDGSRDDTAAIALAAGARVLRHEQGLGNGAAVKRGIRAAPGDWILLIDGDGQH